MTIHSGEFEVQIEFKTSKLQGKKIKKEIVWKNSMRIAAFINYRQDRKLEREREFKL